jgi:hypothetical protein
MRQKKIAEMQEERAEEDHTHVTEMHTAMLQALANQHEELEDLKELIAEMRGLKYTRRPSEAPANLRDLHPRGKERFRPAHRNGRLAAAGIDGGQRGLHTG